MGRRLAAFTLAPILPLGLLACGGSSNPPSGGGTGTSLQLTAVDFAFQPTTLQVGAGATVTVTFSNHGSAVHSFTAPGVQADVQAAGGQSTTVAFTAPQSGMIAFHCRFHPSRMTGQITVGGTGAGLQTSTSSSSSATNPPGY